MPMHTISSPKHEGGFFPDGTQLRVEWVSDQKIRTDRKTKEKLQTFKQRTLYWTGEVAGEFTRRFDPGKYIWKAHLSTQEGIEDFKAKGEFLIGMTEAEWVKITHMQPKMQQARMTTDGVTFTCLFPGCSKQTTSRTAALLHESHDHYGVNLLSDPERKAEVDQQIHDATNKVPPKRGPGRPRKDESL